MQSALGKAESLIGKTEDQAGASPQQTCMPHHHPILFCAYPALEHTVIDDGRKIFAHRT
jgi:hypothetical protein